MRGLIKKPKLFKLNQITMLLVLVLLIGTYSITKISTPITNTVTINPDTVDISRHDTNLALNSVSDKNTIMVLGYHDIYTTNDFKDELGTSVKNLENHFKYLKDNSYNIITLDQYITYVNGFEEVPEKSVLLSFDDGYESIYTLVFPLLKKYDFPAMFGIIGSWTDGAVDKPEGKTFATWQQMLEMEQSGLADMVSHSYNLHYFEIFNPYGDYFSVANARLYNNNKYESDKEYIERIDYDFKKTSEIFKKNLGHKPRAIIWPYGECSDKAVEIAKTYGMEISFVLGDAVNRPGDTDAINYAGRYLVQFNYDKNEFASFITGDRYESIRMYGHTRASQVDIDSLYVEGDMKATDKKIDKLIDELLENSINTVFLQAFTDENGDGNITSVYFYTTHAPVKVDIFSHVATKFRERGFKVVAWMSTLSCQWLFDDNPENKIKALDEKNAGWYDRATPFSKETWDSLRLLFDDLSKYSKFDGILFQDDLYMNDYEDFSLYAGNIFQEKFNVELDESVTMDENLQEAYSKLKTQTLIALTMSLVDCVRENIHYAVSMRNIYSTLITDPSSEQWFAQNFEDFINNYDYTVIMAYPYLEENISNTYQWMSDIASKAIRYAGNVNKQKIIIKIQTYDWSKECWLSNKEIINYLRLLESYGLNHNAMYPHKKMN